VKDLTKLELTNSRWKSIQTHKRNIQCQWISWSHWEGSTSSSLLLYHT